MFRTLVLKELRESLPIVAIATLAIGYVLASISWGFKLFGSFLHGADQVPFVADGFAYKIAWIGGVLAAVLALKQTQWEEMKGTYRYLLYRPVDRRQFFLLKIAVGLSIVAIMMAAMIVAYGVWASMPGRHASPFFWSMTIPSWQGWSVLPVIYAAAFLSGIRPARWFGSKLLPLAGGAVAAFFLMVQPWPWIAWVGSGLLTALYVSCGIDVARSRDY